MNASLLIRRCLTLTLFFLSLWGMPRLAAHVNAAEPLPTGFPDWTAVLRTQTDRLAGVDSDQAAKEAFVAAVGPALQLADVIATIGAKGIPPKISSELLLPDVIRSAQRLMAALAVWRLADSILQALDGQAQPAAPAQATGKQIDWLQANGPFPSLSAFRSQVSSDPAPGDRQETAGDRAAPAVAAARLSLEASQQAAAEWSRLKSWKDRIRSLRGQARLCGTWQWVIHNHQAHHHEQKLSLLFPPPGSDAGIPGLAEIIVLGDTVYLRWESQGKTQEDSLLFSKEGQRLEGTFVNSQGGWGSISGKRTATCGP